MKSVLEEINSRINEAEKQISELEDRMVKSHCCGTEKRMKRCEDSVRNFWDNIKWINIHIVGVPEGRESWEILENIIAENFSNMGREIVTEVREAQSPK